MTEIILVAEDQVADPYRLTENRERGAEVVAEHVPTRYRSAEVTAPRVVDWVNGLIVKAVEERFTIPRVRTGSSLLLIGGVGSGKTHQAYGVVRALSASGLQCQWLFTTAADLYALLRPSSLQGDSEAVLRKYSRITLLVLDDLGASKASEWTEEINYRLINYRYENELPTLITSNLPAKQIPSALGQRVSSRLAEMATTVPLVGGDRRGRRTA